MLFLAFGRGDGALGGRINLLKGFDIFLGKGG